MASLTIPITVDQLRQLARQLSPEERRALLDSLLAERFDAVLSDSDRRHGSQPELTLAGAAEIILTEDRDLLVLDPWRGIRVMRLFQFLKEHPLLEL